MNHDVTHNTRVDVNVNRPVIIVRSRILAGIP